MDGVSAAIVGGWPYTSWPVSFVACSGGLKNILYSFGLGYGLSMASNAAIVSAAIAPAAGGGSTLGLAGCSLYGCYGLRLASFLMRRQSDESYAPKVASVQQSSDKMGIVGRLGIVTFVSLTQALYALPLTAVAKPATRGGAIDTVSWAGVGLAVAGLLLEHFADEQKLAAKRSAPDEPVTSGLYTYCRHPNYTGEILFHLGICGLAAQGDSLLQIGSALISPLMMVGVMYGAAKRLDKEGATRYADHEKWQTWAAKTPSLWPRLL